MKTNEEVKTFRVKKDVELYHPIPIILLEGATFKARAKHGFILVRQDRMIMTDEKEIAEYVEESKNDWIPDKPQIMTIAESFRKTEMKLKDEKMEKKTKMNPQVVTK